MFKARCLAKLEYPRFWYMIIFTNQRIFRFKPSIKGRIPRNTKRPLKKVKYNQKSKTFNDNSEYML